MSRIAAALNDAQQQLKVMEDLQNAATGRQAKLENELARALEEECACVPCKCLQGCDPQKPLHSDSLEMSSVVETGPQNRLHQSWKLCGNNRSKPRYCVGEAS